MENKNKCAAAYHLGKREIFAQRDIQGHVWKTSLYL